ncbi:glycoside hydrolase family 16 protein [Curtobacterium sp. DN_7.5]|uniref:glycoside hydrolase family 16 protein n=1 Tax=Curtobacterium sp. DN_7.5 TaxID=3049047 RepID=UPI001F561BA2|nr:glycoside hydrolase family 16 protein [Curtobacterium sp. DN_7.5]
MKRRNVVIAASAAAALIIGIPTAATAAPWWGWHHHWRPAPAPTASPTPSDDPTADSTPTPDPADEAPSDDSTATPDATPTGAPIQESTPTPTPTTSPAPAETAAPADEPTQAASSAAADPSGAQPPAASFVEDFDLAAGLGAVASRYPQAWQPYPDGTSGIYAPSQTVTVHDGVLDARLGGAGTAGTFGTKAGAYDHVGGSFSVRAKATGGDGNGAAFMLWPTSNRWADGEIDFPEGNFESEPMAFHHSMTPGREAERVQIPTGVSWRDWHTYTVDWDPGKSVTYKVDGKVIGTVTHDVPTTPHRFMFQTGNWGASGNLLIDWVSTTE